MLTVVTPATADTAGTEFNLITVATAREAMGLVDQSEDQALLGFIKRASDVIARHCKRVFARETVSEQFRLDRYQGELILARYPVVSITSITEGASTLAGTDYEVNADTGIITRLANDRPCFWSTNKITVVYVTGYELPDEAPEGLQHACLQLVKAFYLGADRDPMVRSESTEAISSASYFAELAAHLPPDVRALLNQFRNIRMR